MMTAANFFFSRCDRFTVIGILAAFWCAVSGSAIGGEFRTTSGPKADKQYIVVFNEADARAAMDLMEADLSRLAADSGFDVVAVWRDALHGAVVSNLDEKTARMLSERPGVEYVIEDSLGAPATLQTPTTTGLDRIDQRNLPLSNSYTYFATGTGVNAYVLDSGVRLTHQEFAPGRATLDYNVLNDGFTGDSINHGTGAASIIGGVTYGVAKNVRIRSIRFCGNFDQTPTGLCTASNLISALNWVAGHGIHPGVVNISYVYSANSAIDTAVTGVYNSGFFVAAAAGNGGTNACLFSPARASAVFAVSGVDLNDSQDLDANGGPCVDAFAPWSTRAASNVNDTGFFTSQGTSASAPLAAGVAALILQLNPGATPLTVRSTLNSWATLNVLNGLTLGAPNVLIYSNPPAQ